MVPNYILISFKKMVSPKNAWMRHWNFYDICKRQLFRTYSKTTAFFLPRIASGLLVLTQPKKIHKIGRSTSKFCPIFRMNLKMANARFREYFLILKWVLSLLSRWIFLMWQNLDRDEVIEIKSITYKHFLLVLLVLTFLIDSPITNKL